MFRNKLLCVLMVVVLAMGLTPAVAFAEIGKTGGASLILAVESVPYKVYESGYGSEAVFKTESAAVYTVVDSDTTSWNTGWYVVNANVEVSSRIEVSGDVHLILCDGATLTASAGITVTTGNSLSIYAQSGGTGALSIETRSESGIGSITAGVACGAVTIHGGTITAKAGSTGIGGGVGGNGGTVVINGGDVTTDGWYAGIGSGKSGQNRTNILSGGTLTVNGGSVNATGKSGAGIGGGYQSDGAIVIVNGGTVTASSEYGAGIGGGYEGDGVSTTVNGGVVTATSQNGAGIGGGYAGYWGGGGGIVNITGGTVFASTGTTITAAAQGIGRGYRDGAVGTLTVGSEQIVYGSDTSLDDRDIVLSSPYSTRYRYMVVLTPHRHSFTYSANGGLITATCGVSGCDLDDGAVSVTLVAPTRTVYGGAGSAAATLEGAAAFNAATGLSVAEVDIAYYARGGLVPLGAALEGAGEYTAKLSAGDATAQVDYAIAKAPVSPSVSMEDWIYGDTASEPSVSGNPGLGMVSYSYAPEGSQSYSADKPVYAGSYTVKAQVPETVNYAAGEATATFTVLQREVGLSWANAPLTYDGSPQAPAVQVTGLLPSDTCSVVVLGAQAAVGPHTATASSLTNPNYKLPVAVAHPFVISPRPVAVTGIAAKDKIFDGTSAAVLDLSDLVFSGKVDGEDLSLAPGISAVFLPKAQESAADAAQGKPVSVSGFALAGTDAANYVLASATAELSADITPRPLTVTAKNQSVTAGASIVQGVEAVVVEGLAPGHDLASIVLAADTSTAGTQEITPSAAVVVGGQSCEPFSMGSYDIVYKAGTLTVADIRRHVTEAEMLRLYSPYTSEHLYTADSAERDNLVSLGWRDEGVGWVAPARSATPVYRLYSTWTGDHHYTTDAAERDNLLSLGWNDEGIGWYSADETCGVEDWQNHPLYRMYAPFLVVGQHHYTADGNEADFLAGNNWFPEGVGWYALR